MTGRLPTSVASRAPLVSVRMPDAFFLPDLCDLRVLLALVLSMQVLACVLTLVMSPVDFWLQLSRVSLYVQAVALSSSVLLCALRPHLARWRLPFATVAILALVAGMAYGVAVLSGCLFGDLLGPACTVDQAARPALIAALLTGVGLRYLYLQHALTQRLHDELRLRIDALQARIRPHFLFNTLNTIAALIRGQPRLAETALEDLADLFRASLNPQGSFVSLADELSLCRHYLHLESLRLGARLRVEWSVDNVPGEALLPALTLQPLVENAICHGIETCRDGGTIRLQGRLDHNMITLCLRNPRCGEAGPGHGLAMSNTRQRLALSFGAKARLDLRQTGHTCEVTLVFPYLSKAPIGRGESA